MGKTLKLAGILALGKRLTVADEPILEGDDVQSELGEAKLRLVGEMFVTGERFDPALGMKGLNK